jgi:hypothetical protein
MKEKALIAIQRIIVLMSYLVFFKSQLVEKRLPKKQLKFIFSSGRNCLGSRKKMVLAVPKK